MTGVRSSEWPPIVRMASRPGVHAMLACLAALCAAEPASPQPTPLLPTSFVDDTLVTGLDEPNSMAFLPDGRLLFTELKNGKVRMLVADHVAAQDPVVTVDGLHNVGDERGLQGIAVDPRWPAFPYVYVAYTHVGNHTWLVRYTAAGSLSDPVAENLTLGTPLVLLDTIRDLFENHNGLGLRFDPAGFLYLSLGEDSDWCAAQRVDSLGGKLLRLDVTRLPAGGGGPVPRALVTPSDNPFAASPDSNARLVFAYGLRNPWRFHIDPVTGTIALADVGQNQYEEIDEIVWGGNYGWPFREGTVPGLLMGCPPPANPAYLEPIATLVHAEASIAIHTAGFYRPAPGGAHNWPVEFHGDLFYGNYYLSGLRRLRRSGGAWVTPPPAPGQPTADDFANGIYWSVDYLVGPDGSLYWLKAWNNSYHASSGMVRRIRYTGPPVAVTDAPAGPSWSAAPNPFTDRVEIRFRAAPATLLAIDVFDMGGRRVRVLRGAAGDDVLRLTWDGRDADGRAAPPGIYLARLTHAGAHHTIRLLKLR